MRDRKRFLVTGGSEMPSWKIEPEEVEHLVVAMLAVGGYRLEKAWDLLPMLRAEGLTDSQEIERIDEGEVVRRLGKAGYDRGPTVTVMMAKRIVALHAAVRDGVLATALDLRRGGRLREAEETLVSIKGVGPAVLAHFAMLQGATK